MTKIAVDKKETYDYGVRLVGDKRMIAISFDRGRMDRLAEEWNTRDDGYEYEVVQRLRVLMVTDWHKDPLDTLV